MGIAGGGVFAGKERDGAGKAFVSAGLANETVGLFTFVLH